MNTTQTPAARPGLTRRTTRRTLARLAATGAAAVLLAGGGALAAAVPASAAPADCNYMGYGSYPDQLGLKLDTSEQKMANAINAYRAQNGLPALTLSPALARPAMWMSLDSARRGQSPSDHVDTRGMNPSQRVAFCSDSPAAANYTGEIVYWGYGGGAKNNYYGSQEAALAWWKQSPGHNARLLDPNAKTFAVAWAYIGVNAEKGFWTVDFGR